MAVTISIDQEPLYELAPVGFPLIWVVSDTTVVANYFNVSYAAEVYISRVPVTFLASELVGTFKTTPNNAGSGIFDFSSIVESYVKADNLAYTQAQFKANPVATATDTFPIHLINKYSRNTNSIVYLKIKFVAYGATLTNESPVQINDKDVSTERQMFNAYIKETDNIDSNSFNYFGFDTNIFHQEAIVAAGDKLGELYTNAPYEQDIFENDYHTIGFNSVDQGATNRWTNVRFEFFDGATNLGNDTISRTFTNGAWTTYADSAGENLCFVGVGPANLKSWSTIYNGYLTAGTTVTHYTVAFVKAGAVDVMQSSRFNIKCNSLKGYEPIRLCWLNQWGCWDYFTFNMKSIKSIKTNGSTYDQLEGTWNEAIYRIDSYKGGKKSFRVNANDMIRINTDFVNEDKSVMFEELINSPEIYILEGYQTDTTNSSFNKYITPVRLTTSSFTTKTVANDKLIQYALEVEKSKTLRTQSV
tara:strand:- start:1370 stop:2788 length:1419 start_codon:yes stop_codon:yes gene_type:complete